MTSTQHLTPVQTKSNSAHTKLCFCFSSYESLKQHCFLGLCQNPREALPVSLGQQPQGRGSGSSSESGVPLLDPGGQPGSRCWAFIPQRCPECLLWVKGSDPGIDGGWDEEGERGQVLNRQALNIHSMFPLAAHRPAREESCTQTK